MAKAIYFPREDTCKLRRRYDQKIKSCSWPTNTPTLDCAAIMTSKTVSTQVALGFRHVHKGCAATLETSLS